MSASPPVKANAPRAPKKKKPVLPDEQGVVAWLRLHPDFFAHHPDLLEKMAVPHPCGEAVSLVQVRMELQREKIRALQEQLDELLDIARDNDSLMLRLNRLILKLLVAGSPPAVLEHLEETLRKGFAADLIALRLNRAVGDTPFAAELTADHERLFETLFAAGQPKCGFLAEAQRSALFGPEAPDARSSALVPLRHGTLKGILAIGSRDPRRFHPGMGHQFLQQLGEVVAARLAALLHPGDA
jgi:uncharacterized protein YigA (DUF484 family)